MSLRKLCALAGSTVLVTTALALSTAGAANADPSFTPGAGDYVGVGSDTSQFVMDNVADAYNATSPTNRLATFDACTYAPGTMYPCTPGDPNNSSTYITLRQGSASIPRPNGSGAGKALLYGGTGNVGNNDVSFARASSSLNTTEVNAGLWQYPYALDTLVMATSGQTASHAPAALTSKQILGIYTGTITNWNQVGGTAGTIKPYIPQTGSGTRSFFLAQLAAMNGGNAPTLASSVTETQEHDPTAIQNNADAVAPFSLGRADLSNGAVHVETGWSAKRAIYNVVRSSDSDANLNAGSSYLDAMFGSAGYLCSAAAKDAIEAGGLQQLATPTSGSNFGGGVCGVATQAASSNFLLAGQNATQTTLTATSNGGNSVDLTAAIATGMPATSAAGSVEFFEGDTSLGTSDVSDGSATLPLQLVKSGSHSYRAVYTPTDDSTEASSGSATANVTSSSTTALSFSPNAMAYGQARNAVVNVSGNGGTPTGPVTVTIGSWHGTGTLSNGTATVALPRTLSAGGKVAQARYDGDGGFSGSNVTAALSITKASVTLSETFPSATRVGQRARGSVQVALAPTSPVKPTGTVQVLLGNKVLAKGSLTSGTLTVTLPRLAKGKHTLTMTYGGSANTRTASKKFTLTQR